MPTPPVAPSVSVALCTYNGAAFIAEQVASILAQTLPITELVLSDDASQDDTVALVRAAVAAHNKKGRKVALTVLQNKTALGVVPNFEQAVRATTGELVALSDQDDVWHPDRLATLVPMFEQDASALLVFSDARMVDGAGAPQPLSLFQTLSMTSSERAALRSGRAFDALLGRNLVTGATVVFRRTLLDLALPFAPDWVHDEWLAALAATTGGVRMVEQRLIDYRQHGGNQIGAGRLTFSQKVGRVNEGREERNARLLARATELVDRLEDRGADSRVLGEATAKARHERMRSALPAAKVRRVVPIAVELLRGRYSRYGRGLLDAGRDLLQPAR